MNDQLFIIFISLIAAFCTYIMNVRLKQGPVKSSAGLSLLVAAFFYAFPHSLSPILVSKVPAAFFGASFAGMSNDTVLKSGRWAVLSGLIFGAIFVNTSKFFTGFGGGLGTTACLSVLMTIGIVSLKEFLSRPI